MEGERYNWSEIIQSTILSISGLGYTISPILCGLMAEKYGARIVVFLASLASVIFTALTPICAEGHYILVIINRFMNGLFLGAVFPAINTVIAHWAPPNERSKFVWVIIGGSALGSIVTYLLCGAILDSVGWQNTFYTTAAIGLIISLIWFFFMYNTPQEHPRISERELQFIEKAIGSDISRTRKLKFPARKAFTSVPVLMVVLLHSGYLWGNLFIKVYGPKFMKEALGFDIESTGGLFTLPQLVEFMSAIIFSGITDFIHARKLVSVTCLRKIMTICSHLLPAAFLILLGEVGCRPYIALLCLTLNLGFGGSIVGSSLGNIHDLAPNFAGTIYGIAISVGSLAGIIPAFIAGAILTEKNGLREWQLIWGITAGVYVFTAVLFFIWGSGELQPWNYDNSSCPEQSTNHTDHSHLQN